MNSTTSPLLSGLVFCGDPRHGDETPRMWRGSIVGRPGYSCPKCHQAISGGFEEAVIAEFLKVKGPYVRWTKIEEVREGGATLLPEIEHRLDELSELIRTAPRDQRPGLLQQQLTLLDERDRRRAENPTVSYRVEPAGSFVEAWRAAVALGSVEAQRAVLSDGLVRVVVRRGRPGTRTAPGRTERLTFEWVDPEHVGPPGLD